MVRLVSSGTEATMSAVRVARGHTGRDVVVKFAGNYHGHGDLLLAEAGSGLAALGLPGSAGVTAAAVQDTVVAPYNVVPELDERRSEEHPSELQSLMRISSAVFCLKKNKQTRARKL